MILMNIGIIHEDVVFEDTVLVAQDIVGIVGREDVSLHEEYAGLENIGILVAADA